MRANSFEELEVWKLSLTIVKLTYDVTFEKPFSLDFGLRDQIRRAAVSISSNIVEGFEKRSNNEFRRFLKIAKGSAGEVRNLLFVSRTINYINDKEFDKINEKLLSLAKMLGSFINYLNKPTTHNS